MESWFERDRFWDEFSPVLFGPRRWEAVPQGVDHLLERLGNPPAGARILDLCCGPGRYALELTRRGYAVTGVDRTRRYLDEARKRADDESLKVELVQEDMRRFVRPSAFDVAISIFTSFGYFEDQADDLQVARNLRLSLRPGGKLVIDVMGKEAIARNYTERDWYWVDKENDVLMLEERNLRPGWSWMESEWTLIAGNQKHRGTIALRLYSGAELVALLREAGFAAVDLFGAMDGAPYDHAAKRLIAVATTEG